MRFLLSKSKEKRQKEATKEATLPVDTIFALIRRLNAKVNDNETKISTIRRDVFRIEKKIQRAPEETASIIESANLHGLPQIFRGL